jgi:colicin import membrane protein
MQSEQSYKFSFILAITLHVIIGFFLLIKFITTNENPVLESSNNVIKSFVISSKNFEPALNTPAPTIQQPQEQVQKIEQQKIEQQKAVEIQKQLQQQKTNDLELEKIKQAKFEAAQKVKKIEKIKAADELKKQLQNETKDLASLKKMQLKDELQQQLSQETKNSTLQKNLNANKLSPQAAGEVNKYKALVLQAISQQWIVPDNIDEGANCKLLVKVAPGGYVLSVQIVKSSGNELLDRSAKNAVLKASPLPVPKENYLFDDFRVLNLTVRPEGIASS